MRTKTNWNIWRAYLRSTAKTVGVAVAECGTSARPAFKNLPTTQAVEFELRATVRNCTKEEAEAVMRTLNPSVLGLPS
jgi:hypothetical protein